MKISLICAAAQNDVIGRDNQLPWHLPADLVRFRQLTLGHYVVMGRKTYESIGSPLPQRVNVIITRRRYFQARDCHIAHSLEEALRLCPQGKEIFVIGGAVIYQQALPHACKIYLTRIHYNFEGDTFLFNLNPSVWRETSREDFTPDKKNEYPYSFLTYEKSGPECED
jgi:dihydrofolate reductase